MKPVEPIGAAKRIATLDVLRGIALLGILFINVTAMSQPLDWFGVAWNEISPVNYGIEILKLFLVQGKFYTLFAFLFGVGFAIQLNRAEARGQRFALRFFWRMVLLLLIGLFHVGVVWQGDILNTYAISGMLLLLLYGFKKLLDRGVRRLSRGRRAWAPRWLALVIAGLLVFGIFVPFAGFLTYAFQVQETALAGEELTERQQDIWDRIQETERQVAEEGSKTPEEAAEYEADMAVFTDGTFMDTLEHRIKNLPTRVIAGPLWLIITGIFMVGAYFGRYNLIARGPELQSGFRKLLVAGVFLGIPLSGLFVYASWSQGSHGALSWWSFLNFFSRTASGLALALAMVASIVLLMETRSRHCLKLFAPAGRMALTNYMMQSVIGTAVFYGWGLGLLGQLNSLQQIGYIVIVFGLQMAFSRWWLNRFRFGPLEWLWRSATYWKLQPMRPE